MNSIETRRRPARRGQGPVQRERSERKRERVVQAAIACIAEEGFKRATGERVAERADISWGGIQHQFGGKAAILDAVLERLFLDFQARTERFSTRATSIEGRVRALVDTAWDLLRDPTYQAFREIMRNRAGGGAEGLDSEALLQQVSGHVAALSDRLFPESSANTLSLVDTTLFATLSGMAEQQQYANFPESLTRRQLALLRDTLLLVLNGPTRRP
jgi:AcrR family transcriptional regulator